MRRVTLLAAFGAAMASHALAGTQACVATVAPIAGGQFIHTGDFVSAPCPSGSAAPAPYRYDAATGAIRLAHALAVGEVVEAPPSFVRDSIAPGQELSLLVVSGPVHIERRVVALQSARPGEMLFVRDGSGQILSVRFEPVAR